MNQLEKVIRRAALLLAVSLSLNSLNSIPVFAATPEKAAERAQAVAAVNTSFDWLHFDPLSYADVSRLVPNPKFMAGADYKYAGGVTFPDDPTRTAVVYARGKDKPPTDIYAMACSPLKVGDKILFAPRAGKSQTVQVGNQTVTVYGTTWYTPLADYSLVANPAQVSPFEPSLVYYWQPNGWPSVIYGKPGSAVSVLGKQSQFPEPGQRVSLSVKPPNEAAHTIILVGLPDGFVQPSSKKSNSEIVDKKNADKKSAAEKLAAEQAAKKETKNQEKEERKVAQERELQARKDAADERKDARLAEQEKLLANQEAKKEERQNRQEKVAAAAKEVEDRKNAREQGKIDRVEDNSAKQDGKSEDKPVPQEVNRASQAQKQTEANQKQIEQAVARQEKEAQQRAEVEARKEKREAEKAAAEEQARQQAEEERQAIQASLEQHQGAVDALNLYQPLEKKELNQYLIKSDKGTLEQRLAQSIKAVQDLRSVFNPDRGKWDSPGDKDAWLQTAKGYQNEGQALQSRLNQIAAEEETARNAAETERQRQISMANQANQQKLTQPNQNQPVQTMDPMKWLTQVFHLQGGGPGQPSGVYSATGGPSGKGGPSAYSQAGPIATYGTQPLNNKFSPKPSTIHQSAGKLPFPALDSDTKQVFLEYQKVTGEPGPPAYAQYSGKGEALDFFSAITVPPQQQYVAEWFKSGGTKGPSPDLILTGAQLQTLYRTSTKDRQQLLWTKCPINLQIMLFSDNWAVSVESDVPTYGFSAGNTLSLVAGGTGTVNPVIVWGVTGAVATQQGSGYITTQFTGSNNGQTHFGSVLQYGTPNKGEFYNAKEGPKPIVVFVPRQVANDDGFTDGKGDRYDLEPSGLEGYLEYTDNSGVVHIVDGRTKLEVSVAKDVQIPGAYRDSGGVFHKLQQDANGVMRYTDSSGVHYVSEKTNEIISRPGSTPFQIPSGVPVDPSKDKVVPPTAADPNKIVVKHGDGSSDSYRLGTDGYWYKDLGKEKLTKDGKVINDSSTSKLPGRAEENVPGTDNGPVAVDPAPSRSGTSGGATVPSGGKPTPFAGKDPTSFLTPVPVGAVSKAFYDQVKVAVDRLPVHVKQWLIDNGITIKVRQRDVLKNMEQPKAQMDKSSKTITLSETYEERYWNSKTGKMESVFKPTETYGILNFLLHEIGHAIDQKYQLSTNEAFKDAYNSTTTDLKTKAVSDPNTVELKFLDKYHYGTNSNQNAFIDLDYEHKLSVARGASDSTTVARLQEEQNQRRAEVAADLIATKLGGSSWEQTMVNHIFSARRGPGTLLDNPQSLSSEFANLIK